MQLRRTQPSGRVARGIDRISGRRRAREAQRKRLLVAAGVAGGAGVAAGWLTRRLRVGERAVTAGRQGVRRGRQGVTSARRGVAQAGRTVAARAGSVKTRAQGVKSRAQDVKSRAQGAASDALARARRSNGSRDGADAEERADTAAGP